MRTNWNATAIHDFYLAAMLLPLKQRPKGTIIRAAADAFNFFSALLANPVTQETEKRQRDLTQ
jgi:hypothetical protein